MYESFIYSNDRLGIKLNALKDEEGKIWFIGKEVAEILGYKETAIRKIVASRIRKSHKRRLTSKEFNVTATVTLKIPNKGLTIIDECEFYKFVLQSEMPKADAFADWVCGEVLPSLRKNNYYIDGQNVDNKQIEELKERIDKLEKYRAEMEKYADELEEENKTMEDDYNPNNYYTIREAKEAFGWDIDFSTELLRKVSAELNKKAIPVKGYCYGKPTTYNRYHYLVWWKCYPFTKPQEVEGDEI